MKEYTEKEKAIFDGVLSLTISGKAMHSVTVQDIANAAGIGKGTIYDYFTSKEDILLGAILYSISIENKKAKELGGQAVGFKNKMFTIYDIVIESIKNPLSSFNLIMSMGGVNKQGRITQESQNAIQETIRESEQFFLQIMAVGEAEGEIKLSHAGSYIKMALSSNIIGVGKMSMDTNGYPDKQELKEDAYKQLIKILR